MSGVEKKYVYCSGPLFCPEEIETMSRISRVLEDHGYGTFLPHRDGLEAYVMKMVNDPRVSSRMFRRINRFVHKAVFALDIYQIVERCDCLVFNMNGRVPDEGGVAETAVAFAAGKPLVIYKDDKRTEFNGSDNSMITGLSYTFSKVDDIQKIPAELKKIIRKVESAGDSPYRGDRVPPFMRGIVRLGRDIDRFLGVIRFMDAGVGEYPARFRRLVKMCEDSPAWKRLKWGDR